MRFTSASDGSILFVLAFAAWQLTGCGQPAPSPAQPAGNTAAQGPAQPTASAARVVQTDPNPPATPAAQLSSPQPKPASKQQAGAVAASPNPALVIAEAPAATPQPPIKAAEPATLQNAIKVIDLRKFPLPEGAIAGEAQAAKLSFNSPDTIMTAYDLTRAKLLALGCREVTEGNVKQIGHEFAQEAFSKDGFSLYLHVGKNYQDPKWVTVQIHNQGNFDPRALPVYADGKSLYGNATTSLYAAPASVADVEAFTCRELAAQGWQIYDPPFTSQSTDPDHRGLTLRKNGIALSAYISKAPAQDGKTAVQYATNMLLCEIPWPSSAAKVEFSPDRPYLSCVVSEPLAKVVEFYREAFPALGYAAKTDLGKVEEGKARLFFNQPDEDPMQVSLTTESGNCQVIIERFPLAEMLAAQARQAAKTVEAEPAAGVAAFQAKDLPLPEGSKNVRYVTQEAQVRFASPQAIAKLTGFFRQTLTAQGWTENKELSVSQDSLGVMMFDQGKVSLSVQMLNLGLGGETDVTIDVEGIGFAASGTAPAAAQPALPMPMN